MEEKKTTFGEAIEEIKEKAPDSLNATKYVVIIVEDGADGCHCCISGTGKDMTDMIGYGMANIMESAMEHGETKEDKEELLNMQTQMFKAATDAANMVTKMKINPKNAIEELLEKIKGGLEDFLDKSKEEQDEQA